MKSLLSFFVFIALGAAALADIQSPPAAQQTPVYKLGRGLNNVLYGITELPYAMVNVNNDKGNNAAWSFGIVRGLERTFFRFGVGWYDIFTFPVATYKDSFRQPYPSNIPWIYNGYTEWVPELGFESRLNYCREYRPY